MKIYKSCSYRYMKSENRKIQTKCSASRKLRQIKLKDFKLMLQSKLSENLRTLKENAPGKSELVSYL